MVGTLLTKREEDRCDFASRCSVRLGLSSGRIIVNADDWGRDCTTTDKTLTCICRGSVSSVSAMVFMEDSERAANLAGEHGVDVGLHLNFTTPFSNSCCSDVLRECHNSVRSYLLKSPLSRGMFHPRLARSFQYLVAAQREEFCRLYGKEPRRYDGHHHMHLSANVLLPHLLPTGAIVRRHFSYEPGEKIIRNGIFRSATSIALALRYRTADYFYSLPPLRSRRRLQRIFALGDKHIVEVETHAANPEEYAFLAEGDIFRYISAQSIASSFDC